MLKTLKATKLGWVLGLVVKALAQMPVPHLGISEFKIRFQLLIPFFASEEPGNNSDGSSH